ncbi:MAG: hypothetical protein ACXW18_00695 [Pyrinomonadaceae bacterium]
MDKRKRITKISLAITGLAALAAVAAWQFYLFAAFKDASGAHDLQGGTLHLWVAIGIGLVVCVAGFFFVSRLVRYDGRDEMHITSQGHPAGARATTRNVL